MNKRIVKAALIQQKFSGNKQSMLESTAAMVARAREQGADLVCLMELHTSEYFCQIENAALFDYALHCKSELDFFCNLARKHGVVLVASLFEKRGSGVYHNSAFVIEKDGSVAGKYRKMHIPDDPQFYEKFYFTPGDADGISPIETSIGRLGVLICWDQWFSEPARIMALKGAEILIYPTAIGWCDEPSDAEKVRNKEAWEAVQRGHAVANALPVLAINRVGFEAVRDVGASLDAKLESGADSSLDSTAGIEFWGGSFAYGARGELLARAGDGEEILLVEIDLSASDTALRTWPFLRDRRIDAYADILRRYH